MQQDADFIHFKTVTVAIVFYPKTTYGVHTKHMCEPE